MLHAVARTATLETRARQSLGSSDDAIYQMVANALASRRVTSGTLLDVGCGRGGLWQVVRDRFDHYCGLDAVRYAGFPSGAEFRQVDLDASDWPVAAGGADVVAAVETIEHLENPWAFVRRLVRAAKPGGWVVVTTPNQVSLLSLATLTLKHRFSSFQDVHYPAHRTALLEVDLQRAARECALLSVEVEYSHSGRLPLTPWHYPATVARLFPRALSDNLMLIGRKGAA